MLAPSLHVARLGVGAQSFFASCIKHVLTTWHSMIDLQEACVCLQAHVDTEQGHTKLVLAHEGPRPRRQLHSRVCACVCVCVWEGCVVLCVIFKHQRGHSSALHQLRWLRPAESQFITRLRLVGNPAGAELSYTTHCR